MHDPGRVFPNIIYMVRRALLEAPASCDFGKHRNEHVDGFHKGVVDVLAEEQAVQFVGDAFGCNAQQAHLAGLHRLERFGLDGKSKLRREPAAARYAEEVLAKTFHGIAHRADQAVFHVLQAAPGIE